MRECLELTLLAPNSSNLQPWEFFWVRSAEKKAELVKLCLSQPAARTAPELIVAVARPDYWKINRERMLELLTQNGEKGSGYQYYKKITPLAYNLGFLNIFGFLFSSHLQASLLVLHLPLEYASSHLVSR